RILPEHQGLKAGDEIPMGRGPGFPVTLVDAPRALVMSGQANGAAWAWQFGLYPTGAGTRLVSRNLVRVPRGPGPWLFMRVIEPAAFLMTRRMLLGVRRRAEALAREAGRAGRRAA
ncbi:MAG: SRPBCC family protein, partial [Acidobacteria bacterium]|nr:SRPBCC family protein [Acidobacteriota bacterium]